jgi:cell division protein FtsA
MAPNRIILGIDIGSTKIASAVGEVLSSRGLVLRALNTVPTQAISRGNVSDLNQACADIDTSYSGAMYSSGLNVRRAFVGITGRDFSSLNTHATVDIEGSEPEVKPEHVEEVKARAMPRGLPADQQIIHSLVRGYKLDGIRVIRSPLGMIGRRLEIEAHVVVGNASQVANLTRALDRVELEVESYVYSLIAAGEAVLSPEDRAAGCVLIDFGGGTTNIGIFHGGTLAYSACLPVGGQNYDHDLKAGLSVSFEEAQRIKKSYGRAWVEPETDDLDEFVDVKYFGRKEYDKVKRRRIYEIMQPRTEEVVEWISRSLRESELMERIAGGVVIVGGGSQLRELRKYLQRILGRQVRAGTPAGIGNLLDEYRGPAYAATLGLLVYGAKYELPASPQEGSFFDEVLSAFGDIIGSFLKRGGSSRRGAEELVSG